MTTTRIKRHIGNNTNTHTAFLAQFANPTHPLGKDALKNANAFTLTLVCQTYETAPK